MSLISCRSAPLKLALDFGSRFLVARSGIQTQIYEMTIPFECLASEIRLLWVRLIFEVSVEIKIGKFKLKEKYVFPHNMNADKILLGFGETLNIHLILLLLL